MLLQAILWERSQKKKKKKERKEKKRNKQRMVAIERGGRKVTWLWEDGGGAATQPWELEWSLGDFPKEAYLK